MRDEHNHDLDSLVRLTQQGDHAALETLLEACRARFERYFRTRARNADDAQDLVQETLIRVSDALPRITLNAPFDHWLYRIAANCLCTYYNRAHHRRETAFTRLPDPESVYDLQQDSFEASLLERIADEQTETLLGQIISAVCSDAERRVILLHAQHEPLEAIAQMLEMNSATVRSHLMRGRAKVLAYLIQHHPDWFGGAEGIRAAIEALERSGDGVLSPAERRALCEPNPKQTDLRSAALKLAKYLRIE
ncbi:MAG: RNA polymerase sigma factor [Fimbriimonadales bacterium]